MLEIIGTWLLSDAIFSLRAYWGKEDWFCQSIRWIRLILALIIIKIGIWGH
ncbi:MAG: hypothetical protein AB1567_03870 [bacterium]